MRWRLSKDTLVTEVIMLMSHAPQPYLLPATCLVSPPRRHVHVHPHHSFIHRLLAHPFGCPTPPFLFPSCSFSKPPKLSQ